MLAEATIDAAILCQDVRQEIDGKLFIIGVTYGDLRVPFFPFHMQFSIHTEGIILKAGKYSPRIIIRDDKGGVLFDQKAFPPENEYTFHVGRFAAHLRAQITVTSNSLLVVSQELAGKEQTLISRYVTVAPSTPAGS